MDKVFLIDNYAVIGSFLKIHLNQDSKNKVIIKSAAIDYSFKNNLHDKISLD